MTTENKISNSEAAGGSENPELVHPFVSVLMPVRNEAGFIERSVGSVACQDYPRDRMEILIADGGSSDETREVIERVKQACPDNSITLLDNPRQIVATGLNAAMRYAKGEIIVRVDGHCEIAPDYVSRCVGHLLNDDVATVGGAVETIGESHVSRAIATAMSSCFGVGGSAFRVGNSRTQFTDTVAFPAYKRTVIDRAGPFDEELVRNQDDEYNYRLRKLGVKILLASDVHSRYYSRATLPKLGSQYFQYGYWKVRVMQKHPRQMQLRQFAPPLFAAALIVSLGLSRLFLWSRWAFASLIISYLIASCGASVLSSGKGYRSFLYLLPWIFATLHLAYGLGFLVGLVRFWNRWGDRATRSGQSTEVEAHTNAGVRTS